MRIALWNASGLRNIGDRLIDAVTRSQLASRIPGACFTTFTPWTSRHCRNRLRIEADGSWPGEGQFDAIVIGGGALITGPPFVDPSGQFFLLGPYPERFRDQCTIIWNAMCADRVTSISSRSDWGSFIKNSVSRVHICTVRNQETKRLLRECGVIEEISVVPDVATLVAAPGRRASRKGRRMRLGIAIGRPHFPLRSINNFAASLRRNADLIRSDLSHVYDVPESASFNDSDYVATLLPAIISFAAKYECHVFGFGVMYGDGIVASRLASRLPGARLVPDLTDTPSDAIDLISSCDCIVASRLHACIVALATGTPFVAIDLYAGSGGKTTKLQQFMLASGFSSRYMTLDDALEPGRLTASVERALDAGCEPVIAEQRAAARRVHTHFDRLVSEILFTKCPLGELERTFRARQET